MTATSHPAPPVFTHAGIFVRDLPRMARFYRRVLGYTVTDDGEMPAPESDPPQRQRILFLSAEPTEHHQFILAEGRPDGAGFNPINQLSFRAGTLDDLRVFRAVAEAEGATEIRPVTHGNAWSLYLRDPEGNRLEFYVYTPWYISQPFRIPIDLSRTDAEIFAETEALCRASPGFRPRSEWIADMRERMASGRPG